MPLGQAGPSRRSEITERADTQGEEHERQFAIGDHYDGAAYEFELSRLQTHGPVERAMTERVLARLVPRDSTVADVGVGAGHYDEFLAGLGCSLHLVDVSRRLLDTALERLRCCGLADRVLDARQATATDLGHLDDGSCDVVLLLGPLYHLLTLAERRQAVAEARRALRPGGLVLAAALNRFAGLRVEYLTLTEQGVQRHDRLSRFLEDGLVSPDEAPTLGHGHFTTVAELRDLFTGVFDEVLLVGLESFTGCAQQLLLDLPDDVQDAWLDMVDATASAPEAAGCCEHLLYAGTRR
jgi:SAM-dependent methyltransferase